MGLISPRPYQATWGCYSRYNSSRSSIRLQKGCRVGLWPPVFQLGIHPEMLSPAILNKSRPRTVVSGMPCPLSVSLNAPEANFHLLKSSILRGQAHLRAAQPFLFEPWVHNSIIRSDSIEPSVYLPEFVDPGGKSTERLTVFALKDGILI